MYYNYLVAQTGKKGQQASFKYSAWHWLEQYVTLHHTFPWCVNNWQQQWNAVIICHLFLLHFPDLYYLIWPVFFVFVVCLCFFAEMWRLTNQLLKRNMPQSPQKFAKAASERKDNSLRISLRNLFVYAIVKNELCKVSCADMILLTVCLCVSQGNH